MTARVDHEPDAVGSSHELAMLRAAELYYYGRLTHAQIAEQLATSRWTVGRLLEQAREVGIVRIIIEHPLARHHQLEVELRKQFGVRDALVVPGQTDSSVTMQAVCRAAAQYLTALRPRPNVLGVSWGRTTSRVATALNDGWNSGVTVVQTNGGLAMDGAGHPAAVGDVMRLQRLRLNVLRDGGGGISHGSSACAPPRWRPSAAAHAERRTGRVGRDEPDG